MASAQQDSELQHSFGPGGIGFDFLPLAVSDDAPLPTQPSEPLPVFDLNSTDPLPDLSPLSATSAAIAPPATSNGRAKANGRGRVAGEIWLDGHTLFCACPDCRAPMTVRVWLMVADCWRCGASIELSEQQEREVQRLLAESERAERAAAPPPPPKPRPTPTPPPPPAIVERPPPPAPAAERPAPATVPPPPPAAKAPSAPAAKLAPSPLPDTLPEPPPAPIRQPAPPPPSSRPFTPQPPAQPGQRFRGPPAPPPTSPKPPVLQPVQRRAPRKPQVRQEPWLRHLLNDTPAWLVSMLIHMVLLAILAILTTEPPPTEGPYILLSMMTALHKTEGGDAIKIKPTDDAQFDLPLPKKADLDDRRQREVLLAAAQDARDLRLDEVPPFLPDVETIKERVGKADGVSQGFLARDPRLRVEMVTKEGGTTLTEAAVARGLRWLADHQSADGSWSLGNFRRAAGCNCNGEGSFSGKSPGTALAMLPFLGAGQSHLAGKYKGNVARGLRWLIDNQKENGDLRAGSDGNEGMYTHGQATIVLCEAFAMTGDEELRIPAQKAVDFIVAAQYSDGGWRYTPGPRTLRGDTSVVGWQLMALQSARAASLSIPDQTWEMADLYLDSVQSHGGSRYAYVARGGATEVMTAEALLCRLYLGWNKERPGLHSGVKWLAENHLPTDRNPNIYYWYYGTQLMHHYGGPEWEEWNTHMRDILTQSQETGGHAAGSWTPRGQHASAGGRIYATALSVCTLEVYYRHLPIFRQIELGK